MWFCWSFGLALSLYTRVIFHQVLFLHLNVPFTFWPAVEVLQRKVIIDLPTGSNRFLLVWPYLILWPSKIPEEYGYFSQYILPMSGLNSFCGLLGCCVLPENSEDPLALIVQIWSFCIISRCWLLQFHSPSHCISWCTAYAGHSKLLNSTPAVRFSPY